MNWKQTIFVFVPPIQLRTRVQVTFPSVERLDVVDLYDAGDPWVGNGNPLIVPWVRGLKTIFIESIVFVYY